jgi:succinate dehydrogenase flavin-adding protein (antitoxin of CptAB toxin-antitoxin module)
MRELDLLLVDFLEHDYVPASDAQKTAFSALLALSDPELISYLLGGQLPEEPAIADVVQHIRNKARA